MTGVEVQLTPTEVQLNPAEVASRRALQAVYDCLDHRENFLLEAGAGAGKTYTLVKALQYLIKRDQYKLPKKHQKIACITFTNVAKDEIDARTDRSPLVYCDTIHGFCWSLISSFQPNMRDCISNLETWTDKLAEVGELGQRRVEYTLGHRSINEGSVYIGHDDVIVLASNLMANGKFKRLMASKYPIILIDEYQDTNLNLVEAIKANFLGQAGSPQFGFFGDNWQKIYGDGCGKIEHESLTVIGKNANFRSVSTVVDCLNRMRPELPQSVVNPNEEGTVKVFHTNNWRGARQTRNHWQGDLPSDVADVAFNAVIEQLTQDGWEFLPEKTKILMLTHRVLAGKQGYDSLPAVFKYNESFTKKEHPYIAFFADVLEPACEAYVERKYGEMFKIFASSIPAIRRQADKETWFGAMERLLTLRNSGTVADVISHLEQTRRPRLPEAVDRHERDLARFDQNSGEEMPRVLTELVELKRVSYQEIIALSRYLSGHSPFETKHGVKGAEFENVFVVVGRGWNHYNFNEMLEFAQDIGRIPANKQSTYERNRNLFYVACSRPKKRLALLFTQELSQGGMRTLSNWFGAGNINALTFQT